MEYIIRVNNKYLSGFCSETGLPILTEVSSARVYQEGIVDIARVNMEQQFYTVEVEILPELL